MEWKRLYHTARMMLIPSAIGRADYLKKHDILRNIGGNCMVMFRKIPLYPKLISFGNNVWIASNVTFVTHDVIHYMLNNIPLSRKINEKIGCIEIEDNVFIGANTIIMPNTKICSNTIIGAGSIVNRDISAGGVYAGSPVRFLCSFEDFIEKRLYEESDEIQKRNNDLTQETVNRAWKKMSELRG